MVYCKRTIMICNMNQKPRILEINILDSLQPDLVFKTVSFFRENYPGNLTKEMTSEFFTSKLGNDNSNGTGYLTVAMFNGEVIGTCSATRKKLLVDQEIVEAVEIGDTFTSPNFRKNCYFRHTYPNVENTEDYINKSIFGRLATETLDRAKADGIYYVYGTPNLQAKLSWLKRMSFKLVNQNFTFRVSSPSKSHPVYNSSKLISFFSEIYLNVTNIFCRFAIRNYSLSLITNNTTLKFDFENTLKPPAGALSICNDANWIESRFLENTDKKYEVVQITSKSDKCVSGYLFFLKQTRTDGFDLLILSKSIFVSEKMSRLKLQFSRISCEKFFDYHNLSLWADSRLANLSARYIYGFMSKKTVVDIVGRDLSEKGEKLVERNFFNFDYGDSDLG
jgi:hypothetical protein